MLLALCEILQLLHIYISVANDTLKRLQAERNLYEVRQILSVEQLFGKQDEKDILEHWDEDKLDEWRSKIYVLSRRASYFYYIRY